MKKLKMFVMAILAMAMLAQPFAMKGSVEEAQAAKKTRPEIVSITREGGDTFEAYTEIIYTVKFKNLKSGINLFMMEYELISESEEEEDDGTYISYYYDKLVNDDYRVEREQPVISVTKDTIKFSMSAGPEGEYRLADIYVEDGKGNYGHIDTFKYDLSDIETYTSTPSTKPLAAHIVELRDFRVAEGVETEVDVPETISFDITAATNKEITKIELNFCDENTYVGDEDWDDEDWDDEDWDDEDWDEDLYLSVEKRFDTPWSPGLEGDTYTFELDLNEYASVGGYVLDYVTFWYGDDCTEYTVYDDYAYGYDSKTCCEYTCEMKGRVGFSILSNKGYDDVAPILTSVTRVEEQNAFATADTITYKFGVSDEHSGIQTVSAIFHVGSEKKYTKDNTEIFEYVFPYGNTKGIKEIIIPSTKRGEGKYRLESVWLADMSGNSGVYNYDSKSKKFIYYGSDDEKGEKVTLEGDLSYLVENNHKCKLNTGKVTVPATFETDGIRVRTCSTCGATKEEVIAKVSSATLSTELYTYNGKSKKPTVTLKDENGKKLKSSYYTVTYSKGRKYPGTYTATVKLNKKYGYEGTTKLTFVIQPKAPTSVKAVLTEANAIKVTWKKATGAESYHVYYKAEDAEEYTLYDGEVGKTSCEIAGLDFGVKYDVKVVPCFTPAEELVESTKEGKTSITTLKKVENVTVEKSSSKKVKVSWDNISGESGYIISYTYPDGKTKTKTVETTKGKSTTISVPANEEIQYQVAAYKKITSKKKVVGEYSDIVTFTLEK